MPNIVGLTLKEKKSALACTTEQGVCLCIADDVQAALLGAWRAVGDHCFGTGSYL